MKATFKALVAVLASIVGVGLLLVLLVIFGNFIFLEVDLPSWARFAIFFGTLGAALIVILTILVRTCFIDD